MKNKLFSIFMIPVLCLLLVTPVFAQENAVSEHPSRVVDEADILTDDEETDLLTCIDEISERQEFDVVVVTEESLDGQSARDYAADYYDYNDYGMGEDKDGILLLVSMEEREWFILTTGYGIDAFSDADLGRLEDVFLSELSSGNYQEAFLAFAEECDSHLTYIENRVDDGEGYQQDYGEDYEEVYVVEEEHFPNVILSLVIGLLLAFIPVSIMSGQLKSVKAQRAAGVYIKSGSEKITLRRDDFLYHTINRVPRPKENHHSGGSRGGGGSFRGSSGRSHGGRGGRF